MLWSGEIGYSFSLINDLVCVIVIIIIMHFLHKVYRSHTGIVW